MDNYEVVKQIGSGSFGSVSTVKRKSDGKLLVWKELSYGEFCEQLVDWDLDTVNEWHTHSFHLSNILNTLFLTPRFRSNEWEGEGSACCGSQHPSWASSPLHRSLLWSVSEFFHFSVSLHPISLPTHSTISLHSTPPHPIPPNPTQPNPIQSNPTE